jgi:hypothetical protein
VVKVYCQSSITAIYSIVSLCTGNTSITEQLNTSSDVVPHHSDVVAVAAVRPSVSEEHDSAALTNVGVGQSWKESAPCVDHVSVLSSAVPVMGAKSLAAAAVGVSASGRNTMTLSGTEGTGVAGIVPLGSKPVVRLAAPRFKVASADVVTRLILRAPNLAARFSFYDTCARTESIATAGHRAHKCRQKHRKVQLNSRIKCMLAM